MDNKLRHFVPMAINLYLVTHHCARTLSDGMVLCSLLPGSTRLQQIVRQVRAMHFGSQATPFVSRRVAATSATLSLSFDAKQCSLGHLGTPHSEMSQLHRS